MVDREGGEEVNYDEDYRQLLAPYDPSGGEADRPSGLSGGETDRADDPSIGMRSSSSSSCYEEFTIAWRSKRDALLTRMRAERVIDVLIVERLTDYKTARSHAKTTITNEERRTRDIAWQEQRARLLAILRELVIVEAADIDAAVAQWRGAGHANFTTTHPEDGLPANYHVAADTLRAEWARDAHHVLGMSIDVFERMMLDTQEGYADDRPPGLSASGLSGEADRGQIDRAVAGGRTIDPYAPAKQWLSRSLLRVLKRKRVMSASTLATLLLDNGCATDDAWTYYIGSLMRWCDACRRARASVVDVERLCEPIECQNVAGELPPIISFVKPIFFSSSSDRNSYVRE
jgi:hypothetical protein